MEVYIKIKDPILRCYLASLFEFRKDGYAVTMNSLTGAAICCQARESPRPVPDSTREKDVIKFYLPRTRYLDKLRGRFLYVPEELQDLINSSLKKEFDNHFLAYITEYRMQGMKLKDIIPLFILENRLDIFDGDTETLKKRYYRKELEMFEKIEKTLRKKGYYLLKKAQEKTSNRATC